MIIQGSGEKLQGASRSGGRCFHKERPRRIRAVIEVKFWVFIPLQGGDSEPRTSEHTNVGWHLVNGGQPKLFQELTASHGRNELAYSRLVTHDAREVAVTRQLCSFEYVYCALNILQSVN